MNIEFSLAKDGNKSFSVDKIFFHSIYSPVKEAERFVSSIEFPFNPKLIFFIEPGYSYCLPFLKEKYKDCKFVCIRLFEKSLNFEDQTQWDYVLDYNEADAEKKLPQILLDTFSEDLLLLSSPLLWKPAQTIFRNKILSFFNAYKECLQNCKTLLVTRQFFEKKWLINSCNFIGNVKNIIPASEINTMLPVIVCASGPSLKPCLNYIKEYADRFFLICLSSALSVLINNSIIPDLVLSTDGGYWAGQHLKALKNFSSIPLAAPTEAFIPKEVLAANPTIVLNYNDASSFISSSIIEKSSLPACQAVRNPTVSGTALYFAKLISNKSIYFCGLDLSPQKGFQHCQPNELEKNNQLTESRIKNKISRINASRFNGEALKIYQNWFASLKAQSVTNVFRVIDKEYKNNCFGNIKDITSSDFLKELKELTNIADKKAFEYKEYELDTEKKQALFKFILDSLKTPQWQKQLFPADSISIYTAADQTEKEKAQNRLNEKIDNLCEKIRKLADV